MAITFRAASYNFSSANGTTVSPPLPTGWQPGDISFVIMRAGATSVTFSQTSGTGTWANQVTGTNSTSGYTYSVWWRILQSGDTAPTFTMGTNTSWNFSIAGLYSSVGGTLSIDAWSTVNEPGTAGNTTSFNAATASKSGDASILILCGRSSTTNTYASFTDTAPTNWTVATSSDGESGTGNSRLAATYYNLTPGTGSIAPGTGSWTDSGSNTFFFDSIQALVSESLAPPGIFLPGPTWQNLFSWKFGKKQSVLYDGRLDQSLKLSAFQLTVTVPSVTPTIVQNGFWASVPKAMHGPAWKNQFGRPTQLRPVDFDGRLDQNILPSALAVTVTIPSVTPTLIGKTVTDPADAQPGLAWLNLFDPRNLKRAVLFDWRLDQNVSPTSFAANATVVTPTISIHAIPTDPPAAMPGPAWLNQFGSRLRSRQIILFSSFPYSYYPDESCLGGSATLGSLDATDGGTATDANLYGGTDTDANLYGGTESNGCLSVMQAVNITLGEFNDETINLTITNNGNPFNLSSGGGYGLQALLKTAAGVQDTDPSTLILSTGNGAITITNAASGLATLVIPHADLQNVSYTFWRVDLTQSGSQVTAMYGTVTMRAL